MSHLTGNIPSKIFYFTFGAKILQTACTSYRCEKFCKTSEKLISRKSNKGYDIYGFTRTLTNICGRHFLTFRSFTITPKNFSGCTGEKNLYTFFHLLTLWQSGRVSYYESCLMPQSSHKYVSPQIILIKKNK